MGPADEVVAVFTYLQGKTRRGASAKIATPSIPRAMIQLRSSGKFCNPRGETGLAERLMPGLERRLRGDLKAKGMLRHASVKQLITD